MEFCGAGSITDLVKGVEKLYFYWIITVIVTVKISWLSTVEFPSQAFTGFIMQYLFWLAYIVSAACISSSKPVGSVASVVLCTAQPSPESNLLFLNVFRRLHASIAVWIFTFCWPLFKLFLSVFLLHSIKGQSIKGGVDFIHLPWSTQCECPCMLYVTS